MLSAGSAAGVVNSIGNGSFETPALGAGKFQYTPTGSLWRFAGTAGLSANRSGFTSANPVAPDGTQVAFLQGAGSMSQSVYLAPGTYSVTFLAAQRGKCQASYQSIAVQVDGVRVCFATPADTQYRSYQTLNFQVTTDGMHALRFAGLNPKGGDNTAFVDSVVVQAAENSISDGSFESPGLTLGTFQYGPSGSPWQFGGGAVATNRSGFTAANPVAPDGAQAAAIQCAGSISQSVSLDAGTYAISFEAAQRGAHQAHYQSIAVLVDGVRVGTITPASAQYASYETESFPVATSGMHTIRLAGLNPLGGDNTAFLDSVAITETNPVSDGSFEVPSLTTGTFQYGATGSLWQFAGAAGVSSNRSGFTAANPSAPDGTQVAFLQSTGTMTQSVYLGAGAYYVSFQAAQRGSSQTSSQSVALLVDGVQIGVATPLSTQYGSCQSAVFQITTAKMHTLRFAGLNPQGGDNTALIDNVAIHASACAIVDGSFEVPGLVTGAYRSGPDGSPWQFSGTAGVSSNSSTFTVGNPTAPNGTQVAYLQGTGSMTESIYLDAGGYCLTFRAAQRGVSQSSYQQLAVLVDGVQVSSITPSGAQYGTYQTPSFSIATAGMHAICFVGLNPQGGDNTALVDNVAVDEANPISNGSFEVPGLTTGTYQFQPSGASWQFTGAAGVSSNSSALTSANPTAPDGTQVAFLQGTGTMSQSIYLSAGTYSISFMAAQRAGSSQTHAQELEVLVDGVQVALTTPSSTQYTSYQTPDFTVTTAGTHTVAFVGLDPDGGDNIAFLDKISI